MPAPSGIRQDFAGTKSTPYEHYRQGIPVDQIESRIQGQSSGQRFLLCKQNEFGFV